MAYTTEHIAHTLKDARKAQGLSQRALGAKAGVPQSHISKIENGAVDLRASSLVELARVLDLELMLVPRKAVPAVQAIVRNSARSLLPAVEPHRQALGDLKRLQAAIAEALQAHPTTAELAQLQRQARELRHLSIPPHHTASIRNAAAAARAFRDNAADLSALRESLAELRRLRNTLAHAPPASQVAETTHPAYSLDEDDRD